MFRPTDVNQAERVRVLFADQLNLARGKYLPRAFASHGIARLCRGVYAVTYQRELLPAPGAGLERGLPDIQARFDMNSLRPSWQANTAIALADVHDDDGPSALCGRGALKRAIQDWQKLGFDPMIGFEGEAYIFQRGDNGTWVPYNTPGAYVYGTGPFIDPEGLIEQVWEMAAAIGLPIESINSEFDSPQFELTLQYRDALTACDDFFLFRLMARELLYQQGYLLCFMPKPLQGVSGSGLHVNLSFRGADGKNTFEGKTRPGQLSDHIKGCIAGLLKHHQSLAALLAPTVNSYHRLKPASLSGYWANWGFDHRSVVVRVSGEGGAASRIEHRQGDCSASPYVAAVAVLQAARLGFIHGYELPDAETNDGLEVVSTDQHVAESLGASLNHLESDTSLMSAIGSLLVENFIFVKRAEIEELKDKSFDDVFNYYSPFI